MAPTTESSWDAALKILVVGDAGVGKSSIIYAFSENKFAPEILPTIGVDCKKKLMNIDGNVLRLYIWDTAGSERFRSLSPNFYRNAHGVLLVYDVTREKSFEQLDFWLEQVDLYNEGNVVKMLIANKIDLDNRQVTRKQGEDWARRNSSLYIETSARTQEGVQVAFEELVEKILQDPQIMKRFAKDNIKLSDQNGGLIRSVASYFYSFCF